MNICAECGQKFLVFKSYQMHLSNHRREYVPMDAKLKKIIVNRVEERLSNFIYDPKKPKKQVVEVQTIKEDRKWTNSSSVFIVEELSTTKPMDLANSFVDFAMAQDWIKDKIF